MPTTAFAHAPSTIRLGDLEVVRLGYGAMRLPGPEVWGGPEDPARAREGPSPRRRARHETSSSDSWRGTAGPHVSNLLIAGNALPVSKAPRHCVEGSAVSVFRNKGWAPFAITLKELREVLAKPGSARTPSRSPRCRALTLPRQGFGRALRRIARGDDRAQERGKASGTSGCPTTRSARGTRVCTHAFTPIVSVQK